MPSHPYTQALLAAVPAASPHDRALRRLLTGEPPDPFSSAAGCAFAGRCPLAILECIDQRPQPVRASVADHYVACLRAVVARDAGRGQARDDSLPPLVMERIAAMRDRRELTGP